MYGQIWRSFLNREFSILYVLGDVQALFRSILHW